MTRQYEKNKIGLRIKELRERERLSLRELAEKSGMAASTLQRYETGGIKNIPFDNLETLAKALNCTKEYLVGWNRPIDEIDEKVLELYPDFVPGKNFLPTRTGILIPILGTVPAGVPIEAVEDVIGYEEIDFRMAASGEYFALKIKGDSMNPTITDGETVICKVQSSVDSGDIAVVGINGNEATIKRVKFTDSGIMLLPDNKEYEPYFFTNEQIENVPIRIIGKAVETRKKL